MHYYKFNIADYRKRTAHLSLVEHAIYRALIDTYYLEESPLCKDTAKLMRSHCIRTDREKEAFSAVLEEFFFLGENGYHHEKCDEELAKIYAKSDKARASAKKRWDKNNANAMRNVCERNADGMLPITQDPLPNTKDNTSIDVKRVFDYWVLVMGKKSAKLTDKRKACIRARLREEYTVNQIKQAIDGCKASSHHQGQNDQGKIYDDLTLICRAGDKLEQFWQYLTPVNPSGQHGAAQSESQTLGNFENDDEIIARLDPKVAAKLFQQPNGDMPGMETSGNGQSRGVGEGVQNPIAYRDDREQHQLPGIDQQGFSEG